MTADLTEYVLMCVWPILDDHRTTTALIAEGREHLDELADRAGGYVAGPALWDVERAEDVDGWHAYAPGLVLIARVPVILTPPVPRWKSGTHVDEEAVDRALDGRAPRPLGVAERAEAVRIGAGRGLSDAEIGRRLGLAERSVLRLRRRHRIRPGVPSTRVPA